MTPQQMLRTTAAGMLSGLAKAMSVGSRLTAQVATALRDRDGQAAGTKRSRETEPVTVDDVLEQVGERPQTEAAETADVREPTSIPAPEGPSHVRTHETHLEELATRSAADVVAAIPELSTDELRRLYEHESANKKRKTVLQAVERAAEPSSTTSPR